MSDDPFEVKLRDNFELLEDEYNESLKRQKMLRDKVNVPYILSCLFKTWSLNGFRMNPVKFSSLS